MLPPIKVGIATNADEDEESLLWPAECPRSRALPNPGLRACPSLFVLRHDASVFKRRDVDLEGSVLYCAGRAVTKVSAHAGEERLWPPAGHPC